MKLDEKTITKSKLTSAAKAWALSIFGPDFKFRDKQLETAVSIIWSWFKGSKDVILDAPTGSGKSYIAMIVAGVLSDYFGKKGYILISDLSLLKQYEDDIDKYIPTWGVIRGQQTYNCLQNGLNFKIGTCHLNGVNSYADIEMKYPDCAPYCEYIVSRKKAIESKVTICTYTHWLLQQNYVNPKLRSRDIDAPFDTRDFVICDEAHKLVSIVQTHFSPRISKTDTKKLESVIDASNIANKQELKDRLDGIRKDIMEETDKENLLKLLHDYHDNLKPVYDAAEKVKTGIGNPGDESDESGKALKKKKVKKRLTKEERSIIYSCEFITDHFCKFDDYIPIIDKIGVEYMIKNDDDKGSVAFNNLNESYLMNKAFHSNCKKKLYMSATIGDKDSFAREAAIHDYTYVKLPSVFDYTNSPIFYIPEYKMSFNEKERSFPEILKMVEQILRMYPDKRGIIQTGSYWFAKKLYDDIDISLKNRILLYEDSTTKNENLEIHRYSDNSVLVGPSLIEGLSLNDDLCRFQIILKVPYPSLADKYIAAKRDFNPIWYSETTSISVLQGVGRGVRNEKDWCVTFILDACFTNLLNMTRSFFPEEFINRIQIINSQSLFL